MAVECLLGPDATGNWQRSLRIVAAAQPLVPFSEEAMAFTRDLSRAILRDPAMQAFPELMALAHWLRRAHLDALRREFERRNLGRIRRARGLAVHFAPGNVDTLFVYSWIVGLLAGNAAVLRLSSRSGGQIEVLLAVLARILGDETHAAVRGRLLLLRYPHEDQDVTAALCAACDLRVIWGGDETVRAIRQLPLPPRAVELAFADRFSAAVLSASAVLATAEQDWSRLIEGFVNDAVWFDQQTCASPRLVIWTGVDTDVAGARQCFWPAVEAALAARSWSLDPAAGIARTTAAYAMAAGGAADHLDAGDLRRPARLSLRRWDPAVRALHGGNGLFVEVAAGDLSEAFALFDRRDQTVTVYGVDEDEIVDAMGRLPAGAVDRIVPVGQALDFDPVWDGSDLFDQFTREIVVRAGDRPER